MSHESAVQFETKSRIHMALAVTDLERSLAFYRTLLGAEPTKTRARYARFEVAQPPVNLSLSQAGGETRPNNPVAHFGIQVKSTADVRQVQERLAAAGVATETQESVSCCYAVQNKVWAADPDGNQWEVYVVLDDNAAQHDRPASDCCPQRGHAEISGIMEATRPGETAAGKGASEKTRDVSACSCCSSENCTP